ncbi:MAG: DUF4159 domain-containing protein [Verrucomicrobiota bacterium]
MAVAFLSARAQFFGGGRFHRNLEIRDPELLREQEEMQKAIEPGFAEDVFTFARLKFEADADFRYGGGRAWEDDSPEADLSLTYRLHEVTSLKVRPGLNFIDITARDLTKYPFVYAAAGGRMALTDDEAAALRSYLLNGGFLMVDDFWGDDQWQHFYEQIKRVFPDREPALLGLDHRIFHTVFDFKQEPQIPSVGAFLRNQTSYDPGWPYFEKNHDPHYYAIFDDHQRMMMIICHNNHFGDGWEHETDDHTYFDRFSEPQAYPMFINIVVYAMTH